MVATMVILICNNAATVPTSMFGFFLGGPATMVAGIETFNRARILELQQFSWKRITSPTRVGWPRRWRRRGPLMPKKWIDAVFP